MNKGKVFEKDIKDSAKAQNIWILRLNDTSLSWVKEKTARFTPHNVCDFLVYQKPFLFAWECKSTTYKSITVQQEEEGQGMIKLQQIQDLTNLSLFDGVYSGLILNYRNDENLLDNHTYYLPIKNFNNFLCEIGKHSINQKDCIEYGGILLKQEKKRTHYLYDLNKLIEDITRTPITDFEKEGSKNGDPTL